MKKVLQKNQDYFQIGLMRHPPVDVMPGLCYGHLDVPLKTGWEAYAVLPSGFNVDQIYSSPLSRCLKLAQKISLHYQLPYQIDHRLVELHFGKWEGKLWNEIPKAFIDDWAEKPWEWVIPEGESGQLLLKRVSEVWLEIKAKQKNVLIVSHGGPLRLLRQIAQDMTVELLGDLPMFGQVELFTFPKR